MQTWNPPVHIDTTSGAQQFTPCRHGLPWVSCCFCRAVNDAARGASAVPTFKDGIYNDGRGFSVTTLNW